MKKMTRQEMIEFLRGMNLKQKWLEEEKRRLKGTIETMDEAIVRNTFSKNTDESGIISSGFCADKVLKILLNSERDIEEQTKMMVYQMRDIYKEEDQIDYVRKCLHQMNGQDQMLLNEIYIKDVVVDQMLGKLSMSRSNLYRHLQRAVERLLDLYNANCHEADSAKARRLIEELIPYMPEGSLT